VPRLGKLHRLTAHEERVTQDRESRVHQAHQQGAVQSTEDPGPFTPEELAAALKHMESAKYPDLDCISPEVTLHAGLAQILDMRFPHLLHVPTQTPQDMTKSTKSCVP